MTTSEENDLLLREIQEKLDKIIAEQQRLIATMKGANHEN